MNTRWKSIRSGEELKKFLLSNPSYFLVDTHRREGRYYVRCSSDRIGLSVDGRAARMLQNVPTAWRAGK